MPVITPAISALLEGFGLARGGHFAMTSSRTLSRRLKLRLARASRWPIGRGRDDDQHRDHGSETGWSRAATPALLVEARNTGITARVRAASRGRSARRRSGPIRTVSRRNTAAMTSSAAQKGQRGTGRCRER